MRVTTTVRGSYTYTLSNAVSRLKAEGILHSSTSRSSARDDTSAVPSPPPCRAEEVPIKLFKERHLPPSLHTNHLLTGVHFSSVNVIHIGGVVKDIECGFRVHHTPRSPSLNVRSVNGNCLLQMWIEVPDSIDGIQTNVPTRKSIDVPLAVQCYLSDEFLAAQNPLEYDLTKTEDNLLQFSISVKRRYKNQYVCLRGKLSCEEVYDSAADTITSVPIVRVPKDGIFTSCRRVRL